MNDPGMDTNSPMIYTNIYLMQYVLTTLVALGMAMLVMVNV